MRERAIGMWALDHDEVERRDGADGGRRGLIFNHLVSKNRREAKEKPKACHCLEGCDGEPLVDSEGKVKEGPICPVELFKHYKKLQSKAAGVAEHLLVGPFFGSYLWSMSRPGPDGCTRLITRLRSEEMLIDVRNTSVKVSGPSCQKQLATVVFAFIDVRPLLFS